MKSIRIQCRANVLLVVLALAVCGPFYSGSECFAQQDPCAPLKSFNGKHESKQDELLKEYAKKLGKDEEDLYFLGICQKVKPMGFDFEHEKASDILGKSTTDDPNNCVIFVTKKVSPKGNKFIYAQSTLKHAGADYPVKVTCKVGDITNLLDLAFNIVSDKKDPSDEYITMIRKGHEETITYLLDQALFDSNGELPFDHNDATNVKVVFKDEALPRTAIRLEPIRGPPRWAAHWSDGLLFFVDPSLSPNKTFARLDNTAFDINRFHLVSLFRDKAVEDRISDSTLKAHNLPLQPFTTDALKKVFSDNKGSTIALLGHYEDGKFLTKSDDGSKVLISISVHELDEFARNNNCVIVYLGCKAGIESSLGADRRFNPRFAINRLECAIHASSIGEFLKAFSSENLGLVLDMTALGRAFERREFSVYGKESRRLKSHEFIEDNLIGLIGLIIGIGGIGGGDESGNMILGSSGSSEDSHHYWAWIVSVAIVIVIVIIVARRMRHRET